MSWSPHRPLLRTFPLSEPTAQGCFSEALAPAADAMKPAFVLSTQATSLMIAEALDAGIY